MLHTPPSSSTSPPPPPPPPASAPAVSTAACIAIAHLPSFHDPGASCDDMPSRATLIAVERSDSGHGQSLEAFQENDHSSQEEEEEEEEPFQPLDRHSQSTMANHSGASYSYSSSNGGLGGADEAVAELYPLEAQRPWHLSGLHNLQGYEYSNTACTNQPVSSAGDIESYPPSLHHHDEVQQHAPSCCRQLGYDFQSSETYPLVPQPELRYFPHEDTTGPENGSWTYFSSLSPSPSPTEPLLPPSAPSAQPRFSLRSPSTTPPAYYSSSSPSSSPFLAFSLPTTATAVPLSSSAPSLSLTFSGSEPQSPRTMVEEDPFRRSTTGSAPVTHHRRSRPRSLPSHGLTGHFPASYYTLLHRRLRTSSSPPSSRDANYLHHRSHHRHHRKKSKRKKHHTPVQHRALELPELQYLIGLYLEPRSLAACVRVCRSWWMAYMPLLWNTITGRNGLSPRLTIESLRHYGHLIRTAADISHDCLVQKFYYGQVRHLTELCVDLEHVRQAMLLDMVGHHTWLEVDNSGAPLLQSTNEMNETHMDNVANGHGDVRLNQASVTKHLFRTANYCTDITRRNPNITRLEWAGVDTEPSWILSTDVYSRLPNLKMLYLKRWQVSQESFEWILQCCPHLETLVLDHVQCFGVFSDEYYRHHGLRQIVVYEHSYPFLRHFPDLERLTVNVTDDLNTLRLSDDIRQYCLRMKELEIDGCDHVMDRDIALLIEAVPQLVTLNLYCWFWSSSVVQALLKHHRYTIEVVNASDGAMDHEGNLYLNHFYGDGASTAEQEEIQLLLAHCRRLRVFKVPWHGLSAYDASLQGQQSNIQVFTQQWQCRDLETLWILIKGMDAALEIQQLMSELGARPTTAKQRTWIAELQKAREMAREELRALQGHVGHKSEDRIQSGLLIPMAASQRDCRMDIDADPPQRPSLSHSPLSVANLASGQRGVEMAAPQAQNDAGGYASGRGTRAASIDETVYDHFEGYSPSSNYSVVLDSAAENVSRRDFASGSARGELEENRDKCGHDRMDRALVEMASPPSEQQVKLRALLRNYLQQFPRLERLSLGTGEYILPHQ